MEYVEIQVKANDSFCESVRATTCKTESGETPDPVQQRGTIAEHEA
jgi:hypothetical protein